MIGYFGKTSEMYIQAPMYRQTPYPPQMPSQSHMDFKLRGVLIQFGFQEQRMLRAFSPSRWWQAAAREIPTAHANTTFPVMAG